MQKRVQVVSIICFVSMALLFAGCNIPLPSSPDGSTPPDSSANGPPGLEDAVRDALGNAAEDQLVGDEENQGELPQDVIVAAEEWVNSVLDNPDATPQEILYVLGILQKLGLEKDYEKQLMDKLKGYFEDKINNHEYCKEELAKILGECQSFGFKDLEKIVSDKAKKSASCESKVTRTYHYESKEFGSKTDLTISARGVLREMSLMGMSNGEFYFDSGAIDWEYADETKDSCLVIRKIGGGSENLTGYRDGSFGVSSDGSYGGFIISKDVMLKVEEIKVPAPAPNPDDPFADPGDPCEGVQTRIYEEQGHIEVQIRGNSPDLRHIVGKMVEQGDPSLGSDFSEMGVTKSDVTEWDLQINYLSKELS